MNIKKAILFRVRVAFMFMMLASMGIVAKIAHLQWVDGEKWRKRARENLVQLRQVKATRGSIYAGDGKSLLATSLPFYRIAIDPTIPKGEVFNRGIDSLAMLLSRHFGDKDAEEYKRRIKNERSRKRRYLIINHKLIDYQAKKRMEQWPVFRDGRMKGGGL